MNFKEDALAAAEVSVKQLIESKSDEAVENILKAIEEKTPGWIDSLIESKKVEIQAAIKKELLVLADKISDKV